MLDLVSHAQDKEIAILAGTNGLWELIAIADTVNEMRRIKHGYETGIKAQPGVESLAAWYVLN